MLRAFAVIVLLLATLKVNMALIYFPPMPQLLAYLLFYALLLYIILKILCAVLWTFHELFWPYVLGRPKNLHQLAGSNWAVVTGSTDGIGKAYAFELASKAFNLVLISRSPAKLEAVKQEIHEKHPQIEIQTIAFDFTSTSVEDYERKIFAVLDNLPVGLLVNNVGVAYDYPEQLHKVEGSLQKLADVLVVNSMPVTLLSARVLDRMVERNRGIIVNVSSAAAFAPLCYWGVYSAVKKYMCFLGSCMRKEYRSSKIIVQTICPMLVVTKMSEAVQGNYPKPLSVTPENFARQAVRSIGLIDETTGCLSHQLQYTFGYKLLPKWLMDIAIRRSGEQSRQIALDKLKGVRAGTSAGEPLLE